MLTRLVTYGAVALTTALLFFATTPQARGHALVRCSTHQSPRAEYKCGKKNTHLGSTTLSFLRHNPTAGTRKSRTNVRKSAKFLLAYGRKHVRLGYRRMLYASLPPIDSCLYSIILREASGFRIDDPGTWRAAATRWNGQGSGAYGIPQALPGSKMASAGPDWRTNPATQIRWMISYVNSRFGGSCAALSFWNSHGYY